MTAKLRRLLTLPEWQMVQRTRGSTRKPVHREKYTMHQIIDNLSRHGKTVTEIKARLKRRGFSDGATSSAFCDLKQSGAFIIINDKLINCLQSSPNKQIQYLHTWIRARSARIPAEELQ